MISMLLTLSLGIAAPDHFHPQDVAAASAVFERAQTKAGTMFQRASETSESLAAALRHYEEALDLLGDRAPAAERERLAALEKTYHREHAVLSAFAQEQADAFDAAFSSAMERAIGERDLTVCRVATQSGPRMTRSRVEGPSSCPGTNMSATLAAAMDVDAVLKAEVDVILGAAWPSMTVDAKPMEAVGGSGLTHSVPVRTWAKRLAPDALISIEQADEEARLGFAAAIEEGATPEQLQAMVGEAKKVTAITAQRRADLAAPLFTATEKVVGKWAKKKDAVVGWCAQPAFLGGCTVPILPDTVADATEDAGPVAKVASRQNTLRY